VSEHSDITHAGAGHLGGAAVPTILIIDDDDSIRALSQWVAQRAGYRVLTARDGPEGLECFRKDRSEIGLILLDLTMPRMTGGEVAAALHQLEANVPVVLITGYGEEAVREEERIGVKAVLQKPFTPESLRALLQTYLPLPAPVGKSC
jgi:CheY-like chemotaxis protein